MERWNPSFPVARYEPELENLPVIPSAEKERILRVRVCWWVPEIRLNSPVEVGSWNPIIYRVLAPSQVVGNGISEPSTVSGLGDVSCFCQGGLSVLVVTSRLKRVDWQQDMEITILSVVDEFLKGPVPGI